MVRFGIEFIPRTEVIDIAYYARIAEERGFNAIWITDHYFNRPCFVALTHVALYTNSIKIGSGVTNPYHINPAVIASSIATIDEISGKRTILGIGAGDRLTLNTLGITRIKALAAMRESIEIIRQLWVGKSVTFEGDVFNIPKAKLGFKVERILPIYLAAQGPMMTELAAEIADGVLINGSHPRDYVIARMHLDRGSRKAQKTLENFDIAAYTAFSIDKDPQRALTLAKEVVAYIVAGSLPEVLERHDIPYEEALSLEKLIDQRKRREAIEAVTPEMVEAFAVTGTTEECIDKIETLLKTGVTQIVCGAPLGRDVARAIKDIGKNILPAFGEA